LIFRRKSKTLNIDREGFEKFLKHAGHAYSVQSIQVQNLKT
jgi:hypothetical protein